MDSNNSTSLDYDLVIIGGGLTGLSLLIGLSPYLESGYINSILMVDKEKQPLSIPGRSIALNQNTLSYFNSQKITDNWSAFDCIKELLEPISKILVKSDSHPQSLILDSKDHFQDQFGAVGDLALIQKRLETVLPLFINRVKKSNPNIKIEIKKGLTVKSVDLDLTTKPYRRVYIDNTTDAITTNLVIIANGAKFISGLNPTIETYDHKQFGTIADVEFTENINQLAIEYFTKHGPVAFLPTSCNRACIVYCHPTKETNVEKLTYKLNKVLQSIKTKDLSKALLGTSSNNSNKEKLPYTFKVTEQSGLKVKAISDIASFYLSASKLKKFYELNLIYLGNAAHTLHPVSGQGFNLGIISVQSFLKSLQKNAQYSFNERINVILEDYNNIHSPLATEAYSRTNFLAKEFTQEAKTGAFIRDFCLYHLIAYPKLQRRIVNPSLGKIDSNQFSLIYNLIL